MGVTGCANEGALRSSCIALRCPRTSGEIDHPLLMENRSPSPITENRWLLSYLWGSGFVLHQCVNYAIEGWEMRHPFAVHLLICFAIVFAVCAWVFWPLRELQRKKGYPIGKMALSAICLLMASYMFRGLYNTLALAFSKRVANGSIGISHRTWDYWSAVVLGTGFSIVLFIKGVLLANEVRKHFANRPKPPALDAN